jgi:hypothetical protein
MRTTHIYEVRPRKDRRGVDLISDVLPFSRLWYREPDAVSNAIGYAKFRSRSAQAVIRVYDEAGSVIETYEHKGEFNLCADYGQVMFCLLSTRDAKMGMFSLQPDSTSRSEHAR